MAINLFDKCSPMVSERFAQRSVTELAFNGDYDWEGVNSIKVASVGTAPLVDMARTGDNRYGTPEDLPDTLQTMTLSQDKGFTFSVDKGNNSEQMMIKNASSALGREMREVITPAVDTYRLATAAAGATTAGQVLTTAPTKDNADSLVGDLHQMLDDAEVPEAGRYLWVSTAFYNLIRTSTEFARKGDMANPVQISGLIGSVFESPVIKVVSNRLPANTHAILAYGGAMACPIKLFEYDILEKVQGYRGPVAQGSIIHDAFVLTAKQKGLAMIQTASSGS